MPVKPINASTTKLLQLIGGSYGAAKYLIAGNFVVTDVIISDTGVQFWVEPPMPSQESLLPPVHYLAPINNLPALAYSEFRVGYRVIWEIPAANDIAASNTKAAQEVSHV